MPSFDCEHCGMKIVYNEEQSLTYCRHYPREVMKFDNQIIEDELYCDYSDYGNYNDLDFND